MRGVEWVFGYGSLMWRPGFSYLEAAPALAHGRHRRLCVLSHVHRGRPERPGLVLGLDAGGACRGVAFKVAAADWAATVDYLRRREQVTQVYLERIVEVRLQGAQARRVKALTFVVDRSHPQYAGRLDLAEEARLVRQGQGEGGACIDYVAATLAHLRELDVHDDRLEALAARLGI